MTEPLSERVPITPPDLGAGDDPVRVSTWFVDVGQTVIKGDRLVEVQIPGITFDVEAGATGELIEIVAPVDAVVKPSDVLGWIAKTD